MFENIYGLSCVENQVLSLLREQEMPFEQLYHNSAIPLENLFNSFLKNGTKLYNYYEMPRIQDELKEMGVISTAMHKTQDFGTLCNRLAEMRPCDRTLIRVKPDFTKQILNARGFRPDHFVSLMYHGRNFLVLNDIPDRAMVLTGDKIKEIYDGQFLGISVNREMTKADIDLLWKQRLFKPEYHRPFCFSKESIANIPDSAQRLLNLLSVYKTVRHRLIRYYSIHTNDKSLSKFIPEIERSYSKTVYFIFRKDCSTQRISETIKNLNDLDNRLMDSIKDLLSKHERHECS